MRDGAPRHHTALLGSIITGAAAFLFRYLATGALENDYFVHLARAHQILHGAWPIRDFVDPGMPLQYLASAAAAAVFGRSLLTDVALHVLLLAIAAGVTFALAYRATSSAAVSAAIAAIQVVAMPRLYSAPKLFVHAIGLALGWQYADKPTMGRLAALGAWTAVAFLFRHDHGLYLALAVAVLISLRRWDEGRLAVVRDLATFAAIAIACLVPWMAYVSWAIGIGEYAGSAFGFSTAEATRTYAGIASAPLIVTAGAAGATWLAWRRQDDALTFTHVAFASVLLALLANAFLRDDLAARWPDVTAVGGIVLACCAGRSSSVRRFKAATPLALSALVVAVGLGVAVRRPAVTAETVLRRPFLVAERLTTWPWTAVLPSTDLVPFALYADRCFAEGDRVLAGWFAPELAVTARRAFAAGHATWVPGYYDTRAEQMRAIDRLAHESVPVVLLDSSFASSWPLVYARVTAPPYARRPSGMHAAPDVEVWVDAHRPARSIDRTTGLPCFAR